MYIIYFVIYIIGNILNSQIVPIPKAVKKIYGTNIKTEHEMVFLANDIPSLGFKSYYVSVNDKTIIAQTESPKTIEEVMSSKFYI